MTTLPEPAPAGRPPRSSPADRLVALARDHYRPVLGDDGRPYAVPLVGPALAVPVRSGRGGLRAELARRHFDTYGRAPAGPALTAAVSTLACEAETTEPVPVAYRVARPTADRAVVDLGGPDGCCVIIGAGSWQLAERPPVVFRRTALTGQLPAPVAGGALEELRQFVNVRSAVAWRLLVGWLVAALLAEPVPVLAVTGPALAGKSVLARMVVELVDPQPAPLRRPPRDMRDWATAAGGSWVVALDGINRPTPWLADTLTRAAAGDPIVRRAPRGEPGDVELLALRRAVMVTTRHRRPLTDALAGQAAVVALPSLSGRHQPEADLWAAYTTAHPRLLGALLATAARVLDALADVEPCVLDGPNRGFARILAALDALGAVRA